MNSFGASHSGLYLIRLAAKCPHDNPVAGRCARLGNFYTVGMRSFYPRWLSDPGVRNVNLRSVTTYLPGHVACTFARTAVPAASRGNSASNDASTGERAPGPTPGGP